MKKLFACLFAGLLLTSCAGVASAAVLDPAVSSGEAVVRTSCEAAYLVEIPADMEIPFDAPQTQIGIVRANLMKIEPGKAVYVEIASSGQYKLANVQDAAHQIPYALGGGESIVFDEINDPARFPLTVGITPESWSAAYAGEHRDVLVFTISYR